MEDSSPSPPPSLRLIFSETNRILKAQPRHFLILSFLFLIPLSMAAAISPIFSKSFLTINAFASQPSAIPTKTLLIVLAYALFISVFSISAVGSITYSVIRAFHGQPLKHESAIKSIPTSFFRLLGTNILANIIVFFIVFVFVFIFASLVIGATLFGYRINFYSPYFLLLCFSIVMVLLPVVIFLQVNWSLSSVVVVAETTWGWASLKRSWCLTKGSRWLVFSLSLCLGLPLLAFEWINTRYVWPSLLSDQGVSSDELKWLIFPLAVQVLVFSTLRTLISLFVMAANTVMYLYLSKAYVVRGDEESAGKYVSLAVYDVDEEKVSLKSKLDN